MGEPGVVPMAVTLNRSTVYLLWTSDEDGWRGSVFVEDSYVVTCLDLDGSGGMRKSKNFRSILTSRAIGTIATTRSVGPRHGDSSLP